MLISTKIKEVALHTIIYGLANVLQSASGLFLLPILTAELTAEDFGAYSLILLVSSIASAVFYVGMTSALPRSYFDYNTPLTRRKIFTTALVILSIGALLQTVIGYAFSLEIAESFIGNPKYSIDVACGFGAAAISFVNFYLFSHFRLNKKSVASLLFSVFSLALTIALTIYNLDQTPGSLTAVFEAIIFAQLAICIFFIIVYGSEALTFGIVKDEISKLMRLGSAHIFTSVLGLLVESIDRVMINRYLGLSEVGYYFSALRVSLLINIILTVPFALIWQPMMVEYRYNYNIKKLFSTAFSIYLMIGGLIVILSSLFATDFLPLLIKSGVNSSVVYVFILCMVGQLFYSLPVFFSAGLTYERKYHLLSYAYIAVGVVKILASMALVPLFGLAGAAFTSLIACACLPFFAYFVSKKYFSFPIEWKRLGGFICLCLPIVFYGLHSSIFPAFTLEFRVAWLFLNLILIGYFCSSKAERVHFVVMVEKIIKTRFFQYKSGKD
jgi:O-antigen/teichoic acid export membrane protein